jgi:hypothetical protein
MSFLRRALWLLTKGHHRPVLRRLHRMMWHDGVALGLVYDLRVPVTVRIQQAPVEVRPIRSEDVPTLTSLPPAASPGAEALTRINARYPSNPA